MTSPRVRAVIALLEEMTDEERRELREKLEGAGGPSGWTHGWNEEIARRLAEIESGQVQLLDGDEFLAELRRDIGR